MSGISFDWIINQFKPNVTYCYELRPTREYLDGGLGQMLPADQIISVGEEVFASFVTIMEEAFLEGIA